MGVVLLAVCPTEGLGNTISEIIDASGDGTNSLNGPSAFAVDGSGNVSARHATCSFLTEVFGRMVERFAGLSMHYPGRSGCVVRPIVMGRAARQMAEAEHPPMARRTLEGGKN